MRGACINTPDAQDIPDNFMLLRAETGSPPRRLIRSYVC
jgi:hypothetical protein